MSTDLTGEAVQNAVHRAIQSKATIEYLTEDLANDIINATVNATNAYAMTVIVREGLTPQQAAAVGNSIILPMAFNLGLMAGREMRASQDFTDMMLGIGGFSGSTDAGESEHGGE